jgi:two-component system response regulator FlrC
VEDDLALLTLLTEILMESGYGVLAARSADSAISQARQAPVDLMVLDLDLGGTDSGGLIEQIRAIHPNARVLLATGMHVPADGWPRNVSQGYLMKPFGTGQLDKAVKRALGELP